ncbi:early nodulin-like protein 1 [Melia azedarach]|uniref:Early nodulin-like protein 1 n=1 Tax=Melia azedarach TaxID=155640 RepID=A0ACC1XQL4_MELAZ|nr:early nodulin-like protein 1 [Melia azedarach]
MTKLGDLKQICETDIGLCVSVLLDKACLLSGEAISSQCGSTRGTEDDVLEVNQKEYTTCCTVNAISIHNSGNTVVQLTQPGMHYCICCLHGHCTMGLKLIKELLITFPGVTAHKPQHNLSQTVSDGLSLNIDMSSTAFIY